MNLDRRKIANALLTAVVLFVAILTACRWNAWFVEPSETGIPVIGNDTVLTFGKDSSLVKTYLNSEGKYCCQRVKDTLPTMRRILVLGDIQDRDDEQARTTNRLLKTIVERERPDVILQTGDLAERPLQSAWNRVYAAFDSVGIPLVSALGNHEYHKGVVSRTDVRSLYTFPYFGHADVNKSANAAIALIADTLDVFILDSNRPLWDIFSQSTWLENALDSSTAIHKIVMTHHPLRSSKSWFNNLFVRLAFEEVIKRHDVQLVLAGHEHCYMHYDGDYHQIISHFSAKEYGDGGNSGRHYLIIEVDGDGMYVGVYDEHGKVEDIIIKK